MTAAHHKRTTTAKIIPLRYAAPRAPKPIVIREAAKAPVKHHRKHAGRSSSSSRGLMDPRRIGIVVGGFAVGMLQKQNLPLPKLPVIGEAGTIGLAAFFLSDNGKNKLADEICTAALTIAAFQLGGTGQIVGEDVDGGEGDDWSQVGYVAGA